MLVLLAMKVLHPKHMFLNRGNHEDKAITHSYGFEQEVASPSWPLLPSAVPKIPASIFALCTLFATGSPFCCIIFLAVSGSIHSVSTDDTCMYVCMCGAQLLMPLLTLVMWQTCTKYDKGMYDMFVKCFKRIPLCSGATAALCCLVLCYCCLVLCVLCYCCLVLRVLPYTTVCCATAIMWCAVL